MFTGVVIYCLNGLQNDYQLLHFIDIDVRPVVFTPPHKITEDCHIKSRVPST